MTCKKLFIGATGQNCGKTTASVGLYHLARKRYKKVGFIKPVGQEHLNFHGIDVDKDVAMMADVYKLHEDLPYMSPVLAKRNFTKEVLQGKISTGALEKRIMECVGELEKKYDFLIIEGTGHTGVGSIFNLNNAKVSAMLKAPPLVVSDGGIGRAFDQLTLNQALYLQENNPVRFVLLNRLIHEKRASSLDFIKMAYDNKGVTLIGGLDYSPILDKPTLLDISVLFNQPISGNPQTPNKIIHGFTLGAASTQKVVRDLKKNTLVVVPCTRDELLVTLSGLFHIKDYQRKIAGLIISGTGQLNKHCKEIIEASDIPYFRVKKPIGQIFDVIKSHVSKLGIADQEKIRTIQRMFDRSISISELDGLL